MQPAEHPVPSRTPIYFNGFSLNMTNADVGLDLKINNVTFAECRMSFVIAKTLVEKLAFIVSQVEKFVGNEIKTTDAIESAMLTAVPPTEQPASTNE